MTNLMRRLSWFKTGWIKRDIRIKKSSIGTRVTMTQPSNPPKEDLWASAGTVICSLKRTCEWPSWPDCLRRAYHNWIIRRFLITSNILPWRAVTWRWVKIICRDMSSTCGTRWGRRIIFKWESIHTRSTHQYRKKTLDQAYWKDQHHIASKSKIRTWHSSIHKRTSWQAFSTCSAINQRINSANYL